MRAESKVAEFDGSVRQKDVLCFDVLMHDIVLVLQVQNRSIQSIAVTLSGLLMKLLQTLHPRKC